MKTVIQLAMALSAAAVIPTVQAQTADISYTATELNSGMNLWQYSYSITNTTPTSSALPAIDEFTIFYSLGQYSNLSVASSPGNWSPIAINPDPSLPADGFFDAQALDSGLAARATDTGFRVDFTFLGQGTPGAQLFNIVDYNNPATYANPLDVGHTSLAGGATAVPEINPASAASALTLLMGGLLVLRGRKT